MSYNKEYWVKYYKKNRKKILLNMKKYNFNNKEKQKEYQKNKYIPHPKIYLNKPSKDIDYQRKYLRQKRIDVLDCMGGKCIICGFSDYRALQIDHINAGGSKERKEGKFSGVFYNMVKKSIENKENKYQLLCANCNWIKRYENKEHYKI